MRHTLVRFFPLCILFIGLAVGYGLSKLAAPTPPSPIEPLVPLETAAEPASQAERVEVDSAVTAAPITIDVSALPEAQRQLLAGFGITESVTFTGAQVTCAESAIGAERVAAIAAGDLPGPIELTKLIGCR